MPIVDLKIDNHIYRISCGTGEEKRLESLTKELNERLSGLKEQLPHCNHSLALVLASLSLIDELAEYRDKAETDPGKSDQALAQALNLITDYVNTLAKKLETS